MLSDALSTEKKPDKIESFRFAKQHGILITDTAEDSATAVYRPDCAPSAIIELRRCLGRPLHLSEVSEQQFITLLTQKYGTTAHGVLTDTGFSEGKINLQEYVEALPRAEDILETESDSPIIRLINALFQEAIRKSASDIHFEPYADKLAVRIRVDGFLQNILEVPHHFAAPVISRIKIIASLDISEKRLPQDGRIEIVTAGRSVDIRISTMPVQHGERVVLRILDKESVHLNLADLGMDSLQLASVRRMIAKPHGIVLVTGPTGSGKTTTLYAMLRELNLPGRNIMTVEDPVEFELPGIAQIHVNTKVGMTFPKSLRGILRQDPNIIMIGEIRDLETAVIAIQAGLTGHLLLSTLHTNTAVDTIVRLRDIGLQSFLLSSSLIGIIAERLVRLLCTECRAPRHATVDERISLGMSPEEQTVIYDPKGCAACNQTGYRHRIGIYEIIETDDVLREMIHHNASPQELETYARTLSPGIWQDASRRVLSGETSLSEVMRTIGDG